MLETNSHTNKLRLEISGENYGVIDLNKGGSLQHLVLQGNTIIDANVTEDYNISYASAILFPFVNRIKKGVYSFNNITYKLNINQTEEKHAIHGLVYNKPFDFIQESHSSDYAKVKLSYTEINRHDGFPFKYKIQLIYKLTDSSLSLDVIVENIDIKAFPYNLGWHPYFCSNNLYQSSISFNSCEQFEMDENKMPLRSKVITPLEKQRINNLSFDDCFVLKENRISFKTPDYEFDLELSGSNNYVQLYTPKNRKSIAIEPLTSPANSFNNQIGLTILQPGQSVNKNWTIYLKN